MNTEELEQLKQEFLKNNKIKVLTKKKEPPYVPKDILTIYSYDWTERVL